MADWTPAPQVKLKWKPTPYTLGFEDYRYGHEYANPYPVGGARWKEYDRGNADARKAEREEEPV